MTVGLSARPSIQRFGFYIRSLVGVAVLLPAFILWLQLAFLDNVARSEDDGGWHSLVILLATIAYLVALGAWMVNPKRRLLRDGYLIAYCAYIAGLLAFIWFGDLSHQINLNGLFSAISNHLDAFFYTALPAAFLVDRLIMLLRGQREQSNF